MSAATVTRRGRREQNEDAVFATDNVIVLADGVGGQPGGRAAAQLAVGAAIGRLPARGPDEVARAVSAADQAVRSYQFEVDDNSLASCTLTIVAIRQVPGLGLQAMVAHVGDSPAYLIRGDVMTKLTDVHTLAASLLREGRISESGYRTHTGRHVLTRSIGGSSAEPDVVTFQVCTGDRLLVSSDGLFDVPSHLQLEKIATSAGQVQSVVDQLVAYALESSQDNISAALLEVE